MSDLIIPWVRRLCCSCYQHTQLKSSVTRIVSELKFLYRMFTQSGCGYRHSAVSHSMWLGQFQCTVICWYMSNQFTSFCAIVLEPTIVTSDSCELAPVPESSKMRRTPWYPIAVCAVAAASQCSHFSQCFVVKFWINHFQCSHLKNFIFVYYILLRIAPELYEFSTQL
jgi:hypothetical protein